jgi:putative ABC transport system substrate-binding protein
MKKKIIGLALGALLFALSLPAEAQEPKKVPRIGILPSSAASPATPQNEAFLQGLRELGYVEGKTILIEYRFAGEKLERLSDLAEELVRLKVDIIVVSGGRATAAAKNATATIPIVVTGAGDLVGAGLVASLAKPGGNITGLTASSTDTSGKRLEFFKRSRSQSNAGRRALASESRGQARRDDYRLG